MSLHRLTSITIGVPDVEATAAYYRDFGLADLGANRFATTDGGEQLRVAHAPQRRLLQLGLGVRNPEDLDRIGSAISVPRQPCRSMTPIRH
jgi:catechol 2,3-dioxygenase-like lactoylglutathione lyase family enzyme